MGILIALGKSNAMEHLISLNVYECVAKVEQKRFLAFVIIPTKIVSLLLFFSLKASLRANHNSPTHNRNSKSTFKTSSHSLGKFFLTVSVKNGCLFFWQFSYFYRLVLCTYYLFMLLPLFQLRLRNLSITDFGSRKLAKSFKKLSKSAAAIAMASYIFRLNLKKTTDDDEQRIIIKIICCARSHTDT